MIMAIGRKLKTQFCFGNPIRALYYSLFGLLRPVVLEVST